MSERGGEEASGHRLARAHKIFRGALRDDASSLAARAGAEIDDVVGAADRLFVMLDDHQRVAFGLELRQRVEQHAVIPRMQSDRRLVEDIAHAAQVRTELSREPDALRLAAGERRRSAVERKVAQADVVQKTQPRSELHDQVAGNRRVTAIEFQFGEEATRIHPSYLLGSNMLVFGEQLLEAGIVADRVPDRIDF